MTKQEEIPQFASEDDERGFWATHDSTDYVDTATPVVLEYDKRDTMPTREEIREGIKQLFTKEMILAFWTHEKCPPREIEDPRWKPCQLDSDIKHEHCMPCWEEWVDWLAEKVMQKLHSQDVFIAKHGFYSDLMEPLIKE